MTPEVPQNIIPMPSPFEAEAPDLRRRPVEFFPFPEIRPAQVKALDGWERGQERGKTYGIYELPTGSGKSPLAFAIGSWAKTQHVDKYQPGAYILTTQKSLQSQYLRDFAGKGLIEMKGKSNFPCATHDTDCGKGSLQNRLNKEWLKALDREPTRDEKDEHPTGCGACPYQIAKEAFIGAPLGVTNFSYLLAEANFGGSLRPRSLLIVDEAHNTESQLLSFVEIEITTQRAEMVGCSKPPIVAPGDFKAAQEWLLKSFRPAAKAKLDELETAMINDSNGRDAYRKKHSAISNFYGKLSFITENLSDEWYAHSDEKTGTLKLRPLSAREIAQDYLFRMGHRLLFMSATILDTKSFARGLGLDLTLGGSLRVASDFPVANRPVYLQPVGSMSYKNKEKTIPELLRAIGKILDKHPMDKGIIHTQSYALTKIVMDYLSGTPHKHRLLTHTTEAFGVNRDDAIRTHVQSPGPTVLISPSMTEGLDLAEDLSRFQILTKAPYPFLGDPFIKARMDHDPAWYQWQTALTVVQATGRSVRSKDDRAETYLLDSDFTRFLAQADGILPQWWKDALIYK